MAFRFVVVVSVPALLPVAVMSERVSEFCPDDRAASIDAGVLKATPFGTCNTGAMAGR